MRVRVLCAFTFLSAIPLLAQFQTPSIEISPNPAPPGTLRVQVTVTAPAGAPISYSRTAGGEICDLLQFASINGANVFCGAVNICSATFTPLLPGASVTRSLNVCGTGDFAVRFRYRDSGGVSRAEWACFRIQGNPQTEVTLSPVQPPMLGAPFVMGLSAPASPNSVYIAALSFTSNTGIALPPNGTQLHLDPDPLFDLVTGPLFFFSGLFNNYLAATDAVGNSPPISTFIPNDPTLQGLPLKAAAIVLDPNGNPLFSNQLNFRIGP